MVSRSLSPQSVHGRQAEARRNDSAVLEAARDVFTAYGASAPISAVAERAGVGMGTLYRRYGSKAELLQRLCVLAMEQTLEAGEVALRITAPWASLASYIRACIELRSGALAALAGQIETTDEMWQAARRSMARMDEIVGRAHRDGSLRPDATTLDVAWLIEQFSRGAVDPVNRAEQRNVRARLVAIALDGLRAPARGQPGQPGPGQGGPGGAGLPGTPPSRASYLERWSRR